MGIGTGRFAAQRRCISNASNKPFGGDKVAPAPRAFGARMKGMLAVCFVDQRLVQHSAFAADGDDWRDRQMGRCHIDAGVNPIGKVGGVKVSGATSMA